MKKRELTKTVVVHLMIFSLVQTSMPYQVQAADIRENALFQGTQWLMNTAAQYQMATHQQRMLEMEMQKNMALRAQLQPKSTSAQFFPECPLPPSMSSMPANACTNEQPKDPNDALAKMSAMRTYDDISQTWINYYDQMMNEAANGPQPIGLRCLDNKKKAVESQITELINRLTELQTRLNQDKQAFISNNRKILDEFNLINDELNGTNSKKDLRKTTKDYSKLFSPSCQTAIGKDALTREGFVGFARVKDLMSAKAKDANDFNSNKDRIRQDIERDIQRMQDGIKNNGLADWMQTVTPDFTNISSVKTSATKKVMEFQAAYNRIAGELKNNYQYEAPKLDKNFSADFEDFVSSSKDYFKKRYINECVTGADKGIAIPVEKLLESMTTTIKGSVGKGYLDNYRQAYKNIVNNSSLTVEEKDEQLKALSAQYPNVQLRYRDNSSNMISETPYQTFMKTAEKCATQYTYSEEKKVNRGQVLLRELQGLHENFASNLGQAVREKALNCDGEAKKDGAQCSGETLNYKSEGFCIQHASECANEIIGCYDQADKYVKEAETKLTTLAATYNNNVANMINRSRGLFELQKAAVLDLTKMLQAKFPGTNFEIPKDMFISMPDEKLDATGVRLANDGNMSFMDELPKKIDLLKKVFEDQREKTNDVIEEYMGKQREAMSREKSRWEKLASDCSRGAGSMGDFIAKANAAGMKQQQEMDQKIGSFCAKYSDLRDNPMAGCDDAKKLAEDADKIASMINGGARTITKEYRQACSSFNNEKDEEIGNCDDYYEKGTDKYRVCKAKERAFLRKANASDSETSKAPKIKLSNLCEDSSTDDKTFIEAVAKKVKSDESKLNKTTIAEVLKLDDIESGDFFASVRSIVGKENLGKTPVCKTLTEIAEGDELDADETKEKQSDLKHIAKEIEAETAKKEQIDSKISELIAKIEKTEKKEELDKINQDLTTERNKKTAQEKVLAKLTEKKDEDSKLLSKSQKKNLLKKALLSLSPTTSTEELKEKAFERIGQKADEIPCTAQASNNGMPKLFMGSDELFKRDQAILGGKTK